MRNNVFSRWKEFEIFLNLPALKVEDVEESKAYVTGGGKHTLCAYHMSERDYWDYLETLELEGYKKYADNECGGLRNYILTSTYQKGTFVVTVIYLVKEKMLYLVVCEKEALSERLLSHQKPLQESIAGKQNTLAMLELWDRGNCFVLQLKNGHFIVSDGGHIEDLPYLIQYMESRVETGERPVVEAWFISHPHDDHAQLFQGFVRDTSLANRIRVEGIYFSEYTEQMADECLVKVHVNGIAQGTQVLQTTEGNSPHIYHPQAGQTYYFDEIQVDVLLTQEQMPNDEKYGYPTNDNENSLWLLFHIGEQTFLTAGDADRGAIRKIMRIYDRELFNVDIMSSLHHGINIYQEFTEFCTIKTLLYTHYGVYGVFKEGIEGWAGARQASVYKNQELHKHVEEYFSYGDGSKVLTFPYCVGTAKSLPLREARYEATGMWKAWWIDYKNEVLDFMFKREPS